MKYGIAVRIVETGYVEIEADCEAEAKAMAEAAKTAAKKENKSLAMWELMAF